MTTDTTERKLRTEAERTLEQINAMIALFRTPAQWEAALIRETGRAPSGKQWAEYRAAWQRHLELQQWVRAAVERERRL